MLDKLLKKHNLTWEELTSEEKATLNSWINAVQERALTVEKIRNYIADMKSGIEKQLAVTDLDSKNDLFLKARLRNIILLEAMVSTPDQAQRALDAALSNITTSKEVG